MITKISHFCVLIFCATNIFAYICTQNVTAMNTNMNLKEIIKNETEKMQSLTDEIPMLLVKSTIRSISNLFYESVLVFDIGTQKIWYLSLSSGLSKKLASYNLQDKSFPYLVETISGVAAFELQVYLNTIIKHYKQTESTIRRNMVYMTDMPILLYEGKSWATYRFSPLFEDKQGNFNLCVVAISFSTGHLCKRVMAMNQDNGKREIYDPTISQWKDWNIPELTQIEINVLALSAQGLSLNEISLVLHKALDTIKSARKRIFRKFKVDNIMQAIICALNNKVI